MLYLGIFILFFIIVIIFASLTIDGLPRRSLSFSELNSIMDITLFDETNIYLESVKTYLEKLIRLTSINEPNIVDLLVLGIHFERTEQYEYAFQVYSLVDLMSGDVVEPYELKLLELLLVT